MLPSFRPTGQWLALSASSPVGQPILHGVSGTRSYFRPSAFLYVQVIAELLNCPAEIKSTNKMAAVEVGGITNRNINTDIQPKTEEQTEIMKHMVWSTSSPSTVNLTKSGNLVIKSVFPHWAAMGTLCPCEWIVLLGIRQHWTVCRNARQGEFINIQHSEGTVCFKMRVLTTRSRTETHTCCGHICRRAR